MSGNHGFPSFSRQPVDDRDSLSSMRERMDRDREAFFADRPTQGRPWPGGFFQVRENTKACNLTRLCFDVRLQVMNINRIKI